MCANKHRRIRGSRKPIYMNGTKEESLRLKAFELRRGEKDKNPRIKVKGSEGNFV